MANILEILSGSPRTLEENFDAQFGAPMMPGVTDAPIDVSNVLAQALGPVAPPVEAPQQSGRRSVLDIIGGLGDVFANVGGAEAQYQPRLDAAAARERQGIDQGWQDKFNTAKLAQANQQQEAGAFEMDSARMGRMGQAARGLSAVFAQSGAPGALKAWPLLAKRLGIPDADAAAFGEELAANPEQAIAGLNAALNPPAAQGSQPKELQIAAMIEKVQGPEARDRYLNTIASGYDAMDSRRLDIMEQNYNARNNREERRFDWDRDPRNPKNQPKPGKAGKDDKPGGEGTMADVRTLTGELRGLYDGLLSEGAIVSDKRDAVSNIGAWARNTAIGQTAEGAVGTRAQTKRNRIAAIKPALVQAIAKATGMTAKQLDSNADMKLAMQQVTDPDRGYEANIQTIEYIENFIKNHAPAAPRSTGARPGGRRPPPPRQNSGGSSGGWKIIGVN